jgi:UPF0755 protein
LTERRHRRVAALLGGAALVLAIALPLGVIALRELADQPLRLAGREFLVVEPGATFSTLVRDLAARGRLERPWALRAWARLAGRGGRIVAGEYVLRPGATGRTLLDDLEQGRVVMHAVRIPEGARARDVLAQLWDGGVLTPTLRGLGEADVMSALGAASVPAEGRFLPETYFVTRGESDIGLLLRAHRALEDVLAREWAQRRTTVLASPDQALVLASIIEKETGREAERAQVAGVYTRRLAIGMPLQADPTVIYGLGDRFDGNLVRSHLRADTPWNTYTRKGLPPTPICLASRASIHAAMHPADGDALYFVARPDGSHEFSPTFRAHSAAVARYQRRKASEEALAPDAPAAAGEIPAGGP